MPPKTDVFTFQQVQEVMKIQEETILRFFNSAMDRMEKKIEKLSEENVLLKKDMTNLKSSMDFHSEIVDDKMKDVDAKIVKVNEGITNNAKVKEHKEVLDKLSDLEDRSRRNNLRFEGIEENESETWEQSEQKVKVFLKDKLGLKDDIVIERVHRVRSRNENSTRKRTIVAKFLNYKDRETIVSKYRDLKLWKEEVYINEDFSDSTMIIRKELFKKAKELRGAGKYAKVHYKTLISY